MTETVGGHAAWLRPRRVDAGRRQGDGLRRDLAGAELARIGNNGDALAREPLLVLGEWILDRGERSAAAGEDQGDRNDKKPCAEKATACSPFCIPAQFSSPAASQLIGRGTALRRRAAHNECKHHIGTVAHVLRRSLIAEKSAELLLGCTHVLVLISRKAKQLPGREPPGGVSPDQPLEPPLHLGVVGLIEP